MDEQRLAEIKKRHQAAIEGPWEVVGNTVYFKPDYWHAFLGDIPGANFIAHSWQDVKDLLEEVQRLRGNQ